MQFWATFRNFEDLGNGTGRTQFEMGQDSRQFEDSGAPTRPFFKGTASFTLNNGSFTTVITYYDYSTGSQQGAPLTTTITLSPP